MSINKRITHIESAPPPPTYGFNTILYTGDRPTNAPKTGMGFKPDLVVIKDRDAADFWSVLDSSRGANMISWDSTNASSSFSPFTFDADGFTVGSSGQANSNGNDLVAYGWGCNGGTTSSDTNGSITSTVQVNNTAGFSIVQYTANGTGGATVGHGLNSAPELIILKNLDRAGYGWLVYHKDISPNSAIVLNTTDAKTTSAGYFNNTATTSTVFTLGSDTFGNYNGDDYVAYCWHSVSGFSKIGSYTGNGSTSGPSITTGFQVDWLLVKDEGTGNSWRILDSKRDTSNPRNVYLDPNSNAAEGTSIYSNVDFNSNGFQLKNLGSNYNNSGRTYLYWAINHNTN
tara:strand:+ start:984 stop:2012 length:1029 start_codon:yes stop_codon:yes gene_type:complete